MGKPMPNILVFGKNGQLAKCLAACAHEFPNAHMTFIGREECDLEDPSQVEPVIDRVQPDIVVNAAACTAVDLAEQQEEAAFKVNSDAVRAMAQALAKRSIPLIHISTDYVFDGKGSKPYTEKYQVSPLGVYGKSKLAGEVAVREAHSKHLILRTSWVYSQFGKNFVKTMLNLMGQRDEVKIVNDQTGCPTSAHDLAQAILALCEIAVSEKFDKFGTYHLTSDQPMTWFEFGKSIHKIALQVFGDDWTGEDCAVLPITSSEFPTAAKRPEYSVLSCRLVKDTFGIKLPNVEGSLRAVITGLGKENADA
jgi:dTDP-4-dehydrorhamnose reductase